MSKSVRTANAAEVQRKCAAEVRLCKRRSQPEAAQTTLSGFYEALNVRNGKSASYPALHLPRFHRVRDCCRCPCERRNQRHEERSESLAKTRSGAVPSFGFHHDSSFQVPPHLRRSCYQLRYRYISSILASNSLCNRSTISACLSTHRRLNASQNETGSAFFIRYLSQGGQKRITLHPPSSSCWNGPVRGQLHDAGLHCSSTVSALHIGLSCQA